AYQSKLQRKNQVESEHKRIQHLLVHEEAQLSLSMKAIDESREQIAGLFQDLNKRADGPEELRQMVQKHADPQAPFLTFIQSYHTVYHSWVEDTQRLELLVNELWDEVKTVSGKIQRQLAWTQTTLRQQNQSLSKLCSERDTLETTLQQGPSELLTER